MNPKQIAIHNLLDTLKQLLSEENHSLANRDAAIRRFLQVFDLIWRTWQCFLRESDKETHHSPEETVMAVFKKGILSEEQVRSALALADAYHLACKDYNEEVAQLIYSQLPSYVIQLENWISLMEKS
jgi:hypothetical protein